MIIKTSHVTLDVSGCIVMVIAACVMNFERAFELLIGSCIVMFFMVWDWFMERYGDSLWEKHCARTKIGKKKMLWIQRYFNFSHLAV